MQIGHGSKDFGEYVRQLQHALAMISIGIQLQPLRERDRQQHVMVHNPYLATVADHSIYGARSLPRAN